MIPCSVRNFKTRRHKKWLLWINGISRDLSLRSVSDGYPPLQQPPYVWVRRQQCLTYVCLEKKFAAWCYLRFAIIKSYMYNRQCRAWIWTNPFQWRHYERDVVSNHHPHDCLKKTLKLRVTGLRASLAFVPTQRASNAKNVSVKNCGGGIVIQ